MSTIGFLPFLRLSLTAFCAESAESARLFDFFLAGAGTFRFSLVPTATALAGLAVISGG